jgi:hypothetical protein
VSVPLNNANPGAGPPLLPPIAIHSGRHTSSQRSPPDKGTLRADLGEGMQQSACSFAQRLFTVPRLARTGLQIECSCGTAQPLVARRFDVKDFLHGAQEG